MPTRVVSLPCWERFEAQDEAYRDTVLPPSVKKRVTVESGVSLGWERYAGDEGAIIGIDHFGASAPAGTIFKEFGFTEARVTDVGWKVVREGLHGRQPTLHAPHGDHPTIGGDRASIARRHRPGSRLRSPMRIAFAADHAGAAFKDELLARLAALTAGEHELIDLGGDGSDPQDDYPDFAWLRRPGDPDGTRGPRDPRLRVRRRRVDRGQQDARRQGRPVPRRVQRAPGRGARRHERAGARGAGDRDRARDRVRDGVPRRPVLGGAAAPAPGGQGPRDRGRLDGPGRLTVDDSAPQGSGHPRAQRRTSSGSIPRSSSPPTTRWATRSGPPTPATPWPSRPPTRRPCATCSSRTAPSSTAPGRTSWATRACATWPTTRASGSRPSPSTSTSSGRSRTPWIRPSPTPPGPGGWRSSRARTGRRRDGPVPRPLRAALAPRRGRHVAPAPGPHAHPRGRVARSRTDALRGDRTAREAAGRQAAQPSPLDLRFVRAGDVGRLDSRRISPCRVALRATQPSARGASGWSPGRPGSVGDGWSPAPGGRMSSAWATNGPPGGRVP